MYHATGKADQEDFACTRLNCLGEVKTQQTFYGNWCGSRAVQGFKLRFTSLYIAGSFSYTAGHRSMYVPTF